MKQQIRIFVLLLVALIAVVGYSLAPWTLQVGHLELKKIDLPDALRIVPDKAVAKTEKKEAFTPAPLDTARQRILFFGDSMLEGLSRRFADYAEANGHDLQTVLWYSSTTQLGPRPTRYSTSCAKQIPRSSSFVLAATSSSCATLRSAISMLSKS